jgi:hypothetical protein
MAIETRTQRVTSALTQSRAAEEYNALAMQDASTKAKGERNIYTHRRETQ